MNCCVYVDDAGLHTLFACEGETLNMTCGRGRYVGVNSAMFGPAPVNHCIATPTSSSSRSQSPCSESTRVLQVVKRRSVLDHEILYFFDARCCHMGTAMSDL